MTTTDLQTSPPRTLIRDKNTLKSLLESDAMQQSLKNVASKYMTEEKIVKAALLALSRQPKLAQCTTTSFLTSMMKAAQLDLDFSGATGQAYLVPFKQTCTLIVGYQGMIEVAYRSKHVEYIDAQLVYENDECVFNLGTDPKIVHIPNMDSDRGKVKFGYAVVRLKGVSIPKIELMSDSEMLAIKDRSKARSDGPWVTDENEMKRKTIIRRVFKYIPKTSEILTASEIDNMQYDYGNKVAEDVKSGVEGLRDRLQESTPTKAQTRPVESTTTPTPQPEQEKPKKRGGRPKGSKNKTKVERQPEPEAKSQEEVTDIANWPESLPTGDPKEQPKEQAPSADKLQDYLYSCTKCGFKFDTPKVGHENKTQCPNCLTYDIIATADEK